jgi:predicted transcriptional regulator YheO
MTENKLLLRECRKIVEALGKMFAPSCEVVLHDLTRPEHAIIAIETNLSGRQVGDPVTELGLARIDDPDFADVVQNYPNRFPDGRPAKSTSIGIKNSKGQFIAAICLNLDVAQFASVQKSLEALIAVNNDRIPLRESLRARSVEEIRTAIDQFAARHNQTPRGLATPEKKMVVKELKERGYLQIKNAVPNIAACLGISRATIYNYADADDT